MFHERFFLCSPTGNVHTALCKVFQVNPRTTLQTHCVPPPCGIFEVQTGTVNFVNQRTPSRTHLPTARSSQVVGAVFFHELGLLTNLATLWCIFAKILFWSHCDGKSAEAVRAQRWATHQVHRQFQVETFNRKVRPPMVAFFLIYASPASFLHKLQPFERVCVYSKLKIITEYQSIRESNEAC